MTAPMYPPLLHRVKDPETPMISMLELSVVRGVEAYAAAKGNSMGIQSSRSCNACSAPIPARSGKLAVHEDRGRNRGLA